MTKFRLGILSAGFFVLGCHDQVGQFTLRIDEAKPLSLESLIENPQTMSTIATSAVGCIAVNITGPDVQPMFVPNNCPQIPGGWGMVSPLTPKTTTGPTIISMPVPRGPSRKFDVYGVYPAPSTCSGGSGVTNVYFLGQGPNTFDITTPREINLSLIGSFDSNAPTFTCEQSSSTTTLKPDQGTNLMSDSNSCSNAPGGTSGLVDVTDPQAYADVASDDGSMYDAECTGGYSYPNVLQFKFSVTGINLSTNKFLRIRSKLAVGVGPSCVSALSSGTGPAELEIFDGSNWNDLALESGTFQSTPSLVTSMPIDLIANPSYHNASTFIYIRVMGTAGDSYSCIKVNFLEATLSSSP